MRTEPSLRRRLLRAGAISNIHSDPANARLEALEHMVDAVYVATACRRLEARAEDAELGETVALGTPTQIVP